MSTDANLMDWDPLVALLREEVKEYGGLYNLLDRQQKEIFQRDPESVLRTNEEIETYTNEMGELRKRREEIVFQIADSFQRDRNETLSKMISHFPDYVQPLLQALVDEINQMIKRTRSKARQNFLLLSRTMELTQETVAALRPDNYTKTYTRKGQVGVAKNMPSRYKTFV